MSSTKKGNIKKFLTNSVETALGHLDQERKNQRSTKSIIKKREKAQLKRNSRHKKKGKSAQITQDDSQLHQAEDTNIFSRMTKIVLASLQNH